MHFHAFHLNLIVLVFCCVSIGSVFGRYTIRFNDECLKRLDYSTYPRCIMHTFKNPNTTCDNTTDEITMIANALQGTIGGFVIECYGPNPIDMSFDGYMPMNDGLVVPFWRNETRPEYVINFGYKPIDYKAVGKYSFFDIANKSLEKSIYIYYEEYANRKTLSPFIFTRPEAYQLSPTKYVLPCRPFDKKINVFLQLRNQDKNGNSEILNATFESWVEFKAQVGFIIDTNITETNPWGEYECYAEVNGKWGKPVKVTLSNATVASTISNGTNSTKLWNLHWYISGTNINCAMEVLGERNVETNSRTPQLINIKARNSLEVKFRMDCKNMSKHCDPSIRQRGNQHNCQSHSEEGTWACASLNKYFDSGLLVCCVKNFEQVEIQLEYFKGLDNNFYPYSTITNGSNDKTMAIDLELKNNKDEFLYTGRNYTFKCSAIIYSLSLPILWYTKESDEQFKLYETERSESLSEDIYILTVEEEFFISDTLKEIKCAARIWNSYQMISAKYDISGNKRRAFPPKFDKRYEERTFFVGEEGKSLQCRAEGSPEPELDWLLNGKKLWHADVSRSKAEGLSTLVFKVVDKIHAGNYSCIAKNFLHTTGKTIILTVEDPPNFALVIGFPVASSLVLLGALLSVWIFYYRNKLKTVISKSEREEFWYGTAGASMNDETAYAATPYNEAYEIPLQRIVICRDRLLGSGQYGVVYKGKYLEEDVAIKTTKKNCDKAYVIALLSELKLMIHIGEHRHIVSLVGASTKNLWKGEVYLALKLYPSGNLLHHLRKCQHFLSLDNVGNITNPQIGYENLKKSSMITTKDLWKWSYQIANGMDFLTQKNVVHGDLAARNILLCEDLNVKVSDFGLARKLYEYGVYKKESQEPLPWRWMSVEALKLMTFSTKSDVWSYGITLWEIFSLGLIPYPGISWNVDFVEQLSAGLRLSKPNHALDNIYDLMISCWHDAPEKRPFFSDINRFLYQNLTEMPVDPYSGATYI